MEKKMWNTDTHSFIVLVFCDNVAKERSKIQAYLLCCRYSWFLCFLTNLMFVTRLHEESVGTIFQLPLLTLSLCYIFVILALSYIYSLIIVIFVTVTCDKCALLLLLQIEYNWLKTQMIAFLNNKAFINWDICITLLDIIHLIDYNRVYTKFYMH